MPSSRSPSSPHHGSDGDDGTNSSRLDPGAGVTLLTPSHSHSSHSRSRRPRPDRKADAWLRIGLLVVLGVSLLALQSEGGQGSPNVRGSSSTTTTSSFSVSNSHLVHHRDVHAFVAQHHRRLETSGSTGSSASTPSSALDSATAKANEVGTAVRKAIKQLRGGTDKFYRDLITAATIWLCDRQVNHPAAGAVNPRERFVAKTDDRAYKNAANDDVQVLITPATDDKVKEAYSLDLAEVKPNCYWGEIDPDVDTERRPVYSITEAAQPLDGAMTLSESKDLLMKWAQGLGIFVVPGIILSVLSLLTMILFLSCRCCCNRCGGRKPREGGYSCMQRFLPILFFLLFSIGVVAVAAASLVYQKTVTQAGTDLFNIATATLNSTMDRFVLVRSPLESVRDQVDISAADISTQLEGTDFIKDGIGGLTTKLQDFGEYSADRTLPAGCQRSASEPYCLPCQVCTTISTEVSSASSQISANAGDGVAQLAQVRTDLNDKLVKIADDAKSSIDVNVKIINDLYDTVDKIYGDVHSIQTEYDNQQTPQKVSVLGFFALALVVIALGLLGILFGLTPLKFLANIIHVAYFIGFLALILTFLISAVFLAISVVLGDVCEVTTILTEDWEVVMGDAAKGVNACFRNESLIDAFNLSSVLEFATGGLKFPNNLNMNAMLNFTDLDTFATTILDTDASTFPLDEGEMQTFLNSVNAYTTQSRGMCQVTDSYSLGNILDPWDAHAEPAPSDGTTAEQYMLARYRPFDADCAGHPDGLDFQCSRGQQPCAYADFVVELYHNVSMLAMVKRDSVTFIDELHTNISRVTDYTDEFKNKTRVLQASIEEIKADLDTSLIKYVGEFEDVMYCTFLADNFDELYGTICGDLLPALTMISLMVFLAAVFLIPVTVCLIIGLKRLKASGNGGPIVDNEMKFK